MRKLSILAAVTCLCAIQSAAKRVKRSPIPDGLSEYESYSTSLGENRNRGSRVLQDIRTVPTRQSHSQNSRTNIVYGKGRLAEQPKPNRQQHSHSVQKKKNAKFVPSPIDTAFEDGQSQYAGNFKSDPALLQKYMQKYANQLYTAQKHAGQLSESQKYVLGQDPYAKKFVVSQSIQAKYPSSPKFIPLTALETKPSLSKYQDDSSESVEPITAAEKHQNYQSQPKAEKLKAPKKAFTVDSAPQSTDLKYSSLYGNSLEPQVVNQYLSSYGSQDKESYSGYEPHQSYGHYGVADKVEFPKITGYKIPGAVSLSLGHNVEEASHSDVTHGHEDHHYPSAEPKYEFMYQVKDPEKHNHFGHAEARKGKTTWGKYYVQLPDGRFETVKYWADKSGYHAEVDFKGHAKHPSHKEHSLPLQEDVHSGLGSSYVGHHSHREYSIAEQTEEYH